MTDFENWWQTYPRKIGKLAAKRAWTKALQEDTAEAIIAGLEAQLPTLRSTDKQFVPHPSTWLNQGRWMDEVDQGNPQDRSYDTWTDAEKRDVAEFVSKWGEQFAVSNARYLKADIERLRVEGYLQPRRATG